MSDVVFNPVIPELVVRDLNASLSFYVDVLGFHVVFERPEDRFAFIQFERVQFMLEQQHDTAWITAPLEYPLGRGVNFEMGVHDIDGVLARLKTAQYTLFRPLMRNEYRAGEATNISIEFLVQDPDGYLLRFAQERLL
jgi:catechol 2,3-dioxygenase-like lactoylglutathione lyase family enzyme